MAKLAQTSVKYVINAEFTAEGVVEKPDVIGALFGQTEGLLGPELDLRELQRTGRVGRIEVDVKSTKGKSKGIIIIPSSLDSTETTLIAATLETVERLGPCDAKIMILSIDDLRTIKRDFIKDRAKKLLSELLQSIPEVSTVSEELKQAVRSAEIMEFRGFPAGPDVETADTLIICEGRADVVNLLKNGIKNAIAVGGTSVPEEIALFTKEKETTVFLDGDRGGDLILKELKQVADIDFVARAPIGKEVEELTKKEIFKSLRDKVPIEQALEIIKNGEQKEGDKQIEAPVLTYTKYEEKRPYTRKTVAPSTYRKRGLDSETKELFKTQINELIGTKAASIFDRNMKFAGRVPLTELGRSIRQVVSPHVLFVDAAVDRELCDLAERNGIKYLVGMDIKFMPRSRNLKVLKQKDFEAEAVE